MSFYANAAAIFLNPVKEEVCLVAEILDMFGQVSGLVTNRNKCVVYPIRCDLMDIEEVMEGFPCSSTLVNSQTGTKLPDVQQKTQVLARWSSTEEFGPQSLQSRMAETIVG